MVTRLDLSHFFTEWLESSNNQWLEIRVRVIFAKSWNRLSDKQAYFAEMSIFASVTHGLLLAQNFSCGWLCPLLVVWYYIWLSASGLSPWHWGSLCISAVAATCDALSITFLVAGKLMGAPFSLVRKCAGKPLLQLWRCGAQRGREFETASFAKP